MKVNQLLIPNDLADVHCSEIMQKASNRWQHYLAKPSFSIVAKNTISNGNLSKVHTVLLILVGMSYFLAGNQGNYQNLVQSMLTYKF